MIEIIAEVGSTWWRPDPALAQDAALESIHQAARVGATGVKFQLFRADSLFNPQRAEALHGQFQRFELPLEWIPQLRFTADNVNVQFWLSVFSPDLVEEAVEYCDVIKIASGDITYEPLIIKVKEMAKTFNRRVAFSTGAANQAEIVHAACLLGDDLTLIPMHCRSIYPSHPNEMGLQEGLALRNISPVIGLSDHTCSNITAQVAVGMGYEVFEKHFCLPSGTPPEIPDTVVATTATRKGKGNSFRDYVEAIRQAEAIVGKEPGKTIHPAEYPERVMARRGEDGLRPLREVES